MSAAELRVWRNQSTTRKLMRYLGRWRAMVLEQLAEGATTAETADATAMLTTEAVSKAQLLKDLLTLEASDIARFYGLAEPKERDAKA